MANTTYTQSSLPLLPAHLQSDTQITSHLASRYHIGLPTATLSSQALLSLNTFTHAEKGPDGKKDGSAAAEIDSIATRAITRLGIRQENQAIVFLGESGAGKTTLRSHLLTSLLEHSSTPLSQKISYASFVFDTLTTTKSITTPTASKAGLFLELQYDGGASSNPTLVGAKVLDHRLERSRLASVPTGERSFHALYYLLAGTSPAEKSHLALESSGIVSEANAAISNRSSALIGHKRWRYLGHPTQLKVGINDAEGFQHFKTALRKLEFPRNEVGEICQLLATVLHLGQLEFMVTQETMPTADESGGYSHEGGEDITAVRNKDVLRTIAAFLGLAQDDLEMSLRYKTKSIRKERVTIMLDPLGARESADELARILYSLLVAYVVEQMNQRLCAAEEGIANTISIVDFPGFAQSASTGSVLDQLLNNAATESLYNLCLQDFFDRRAELLETEDVAVPASSYFDNSDAVRALLKPTNGLLSILDDQTRRGKTDFQLVESLHKRFDGKNPAITVSAATVKQPGSNFVSRNTAAKFTIRHYAGEVDYPVEGLVEANGEVITGDVMNLLKSTKSKFVLDLLGQDALTTVMHPQEKSAVLQAQVSSMPSRKPSMARRGLKSVRERAEIPPLPEIEVSHDAIPSSDGPRKLESGASGQFLSALSTITKSLTSPNTNSYFVFCLKPNDRRIANQFDSKCVRAQIQALGIAEITQRLRAADFSIFLPFSEFLGLLGNETAPIVGSEREQVEHHLLEKKWPKNEALLGATGVFLNENRWLEIADRVVPSPRRSFEYDSDDGYRDERYDSNARLLDTPPSNEVFSKPAYARSDAALSTYKGDMFRDFDTRDELAKRGNEKKLVEVETVVTSGSRRRWLSIVWLLTFFIPNFVLASLGKMKRRDVQTAWREKLAINMLIWLSCLAALFFIVGFPALICPTQHVFSASELSSHNGQDSATSYIAIRGVVFNLGNFIPNHFPKSNLIPETQFTPYAGIDATALFPVQVSSMCIGPNGPLSDQIVLNSQPTNVSGSALVSSGLDPNANYHDFRYSYSPNDTRPDWFQEQMIMLNQNYRVGYIGYTAEYVNTLGTTKGRSIGIIDGRIYDFTDYINGRPSIVAPEGVTPAPQSDAQFMDASVVNLFSTNTGQDLTSSFNGLSLSSEERTNVLNCLNNLFFIGVQDTRNSTKCLFAQYLLLVVSILLVSVIGFKFFAALQFGKKNFPENLDKFIICQVPAYTEDEDSLRRAIDSAAKMKYDDKRKLLVIICDGMIIGQGNDRPTPRIVLDILGVSDDVDPEPLSFESLGEGLKQHNMGKVYSGLYEVHGHIVPFLVIVKVGKPSEVSRPGNRGKRDSQMLLMRFLNRVHYNLAMNPLELEMHHQIRDVIGVNPTFYEFMLQIDADTVVAPDSASRFVAAFIEDSRLIGICGETALTNAKASFVTMIQVYEYYISHNLTKAFESLFGSVTCLPGCFTMYRIRAAETGKPLFVSRDVVEAYANIRVDTLHMKNLLHLGEDRYLTTLLLKYHNKYKTKYTFHAHAWTIAPDSWKIFLSQRRRWINSTVHNLVELMPMQQLCGFCCFSMRFIVFLDLLSTIVAPVTVFYIAYLIVLIAINTTVIPLTAFILLGAIYGLQAIIFILRRRWEMVAWMLIYILAMPVFSLGLPLYAFWHMDDFSWGNTRIVTGEKGNKVLVTDEGVFDPDSIPRKKWEDYQAEMAELMGTRGDYPDNKSEYSVISYGTKAFPIAAPRSKSRQTSHDLRVMSRNSLAPSDMLSTRPQSMLLEEMGGNGNGNMPSDDVLLAETRDILSTADLMNVTKRGVKTQLEGRLGVKLDAKRMYISTAVEAILSGRL